MSPPGSSSDSSPALTSGPNSGPTANRYRLPRTAVPAHYEICIEPDLEAGTFAGSESVTLDLVEPVDRLVLNALELDIDEAWVEGADGGRTDASPAFDVGTERATLTLAGPAGAGRVTLHLRFRGVLNDKLVGFYRSTFTDDEGAEHVIATTQMEATHARQAFPCWDEPDFKATFAVTLVVPAGLVALSNGAMEAEELMADGRRRARFATTMAMSTYLVAFVVGPLAVTDEVRVPDGTTAGAERPGTPLRVAYPPERGALTAFALESGAFALRYFAEYYDIGYPGGKLDLVAIPDFAFGAMENLGCVTFREILLLVDPARATQPDLQRVADVIHHEIAHMWFGDLVTMRWWNGIWLNEAFATFMEMKCTDAFRPQWERWVDFGTSRTAAFDVDSLESTRPIEFDVISPRDAEGMFDVLTYEKGAAVLRMLEQYLGEDAFRDGVRRYLADHAYANTETTDLWDAIEAATNQPVRRIMDSWIFQGGYPVVSVELRTEPGQGSGPGPRAGVATLHLGQQRFRNAGGAAQDPLGETWVVPVVARYGRQDGAGHHGDFGPATDERELKLLLDGSEHEVTLEFVPDWVLVNAGASGFYRARYSSALLHALGRLGPGSLDPLERYQLVDDAYASVLAGETSAAEFLVLARSFGDDTDLSVWQRLAGALGAIDRILDDEARPRYQALVRGIVGPALLRLGQEPEPGELARRGQLRGTLLELLGTVGDDQDAKLRARALHEAYLADPGSVDPALAAAAIGVVATSGGPEEFDLFWARHQQADDPQTAIRYLHALARFEDPALTERMLALATTEMRTQDAPYVLGRALANRRAGAQVWEYIRRNWRSVNERFPSNSIVRMLGGLAAVTDATLAGDVRAFFADHDVPQGAKSLEQHLERMQVGVALREREAGALAESLA